MVMVMVMMVIVMVMAMVMGGDDDVLLQPAQLVALAERRLVLLLESSPHLRLGLLELLVLLREQPLDLFDLLLHLPELLLVPLDRLPGRRAAARRPGPPAAPPPRPAMGREGLQLHHRGRRSKLATWSPQGLSWRGLRS